MVCWRTVDTLDSIVPALGFAVGAGSMGLNVVCSIRFTNRSASCSSLLLHTSVKLHHHAALTQTHALSHLVCGGVQIHQDSPVTEQIQAENEIWQFDSRTECSQRTNWALYDNRRHFWAHSVIAKVYACWNRLTVTWNATCNELFRTR